VVLVAFSNTEMMGYYAYSGDSQIVGLHTAEIMQTITAAIRRRRREMAKKRRRKEQTSAAESM